MVTIEGNSNYNIENFEIMDVFSHSDIKLLKKYNVRMKNIIFTHRASYMTCLSYDLSDDTCVYTKG